MINIVIPSVEGGSSPLQNAQSVWLAGMEPEECAECLRREELIRRWEESQGAKSAVSSTSAGARQQHRKGCAPQLLREAATQRGVLAPKHYR